MDTRKINVLGAEYTLSVCCEDEDSRLAGCDGFCDETSKELVESGLAENSEWAQNEEMVDFFAIQFPKLMEVFKNADAI